MDLRVKTPTSIDISDWLNTVTDKAHQFDNLVSAINLVLQRKHPGEVGLWWVEYKQGNWTVHTPDGVADTDSVARVLELIMVIPKP